MGSHTALLWWVWIKSYIKIVDKSIKMAWRNVERAKR
jgi:hypothetical protein